MRKARLSEMTKGWFIGSFTPTLLDTTAVEVAIKRYNAGERETAHYHKIATEFTAIISGKVIMNGVEYEEGDIVVVEPHEITDFEACVETVTVVVKCPGASNDKYTRGD